MRDYQEFLAEKKVIAQTSGIDVSLEDIHSLLFPFQRTLVQWALRKGRAALFEDCGLGKTLQQLEWARLTGQKTLILAPLAVAQQTVAEGLKIGVEVHYTRSGSNTIPGINITNYEMLEHFNPDDFGAVVLDESSILKSYMGKTKIALVDAFKRTPFRLCCTATPAPNDVMEIGNHSEFLGIMPSNEMLMRWFINDTMQNGHYRLKGHATKDFWDWVASWAISLQKPSDIGFSDEGFVLPELRIQHHSVEVDTSTGQAEGELFRMPTMSATTLHKEMRLTVEDRAACVAELVLKDWLCGKKNTLQTEEQNINQVRKSEQSESHKGVHLMPTASTCTTTTNPIKENSICTEKLTSPNAMTDDANATQPMKNTESKNVQMPESKMQLTLQENDMVGSNLPMESELKNTNNSLLNKRENVQFAETLKPTKTNMELSDSLSITAIQAEKSEGYSVPLATLESGSSRMTLKDFVKQLRTSKSSLIKTFQNNLDSWVIWCNTNYEQDELDKLFGDTAFSVRGSQSLTEKEHCIIGWLNSERPVLISKPSICGFGMNFQHCHNTAFVGLSYSFEQFYQAIRRLYRFGQKEEVQCHIIAAETEGAMVATLERKIQAHMQMSEQMNASVAKLGLQENLNLTQYNPQIPMIVPEWLHSENERKST